MKDLTEQEVFEKFGVKPKYEVGTRIYDRANEYHGIIKEYRYVLDPFNNKDLIVMVWYDITWKNGKINKGATNWTREGNIRPVLEHFEERIKYHTDRIKYLEEREEFYTSLIATETETNPNPLDN